MHVLTIAVKDSPVTRLICI